MYPASHYQRISSCAFTNSAAAYHLSDAGVATPPTVVFPTLARTGDQLSSGTVGAGTLGSQLLLHRFSGIPC